MPGGGWGPPVVERFWTCGCLAPLGFPSGWRDSFFPLPVHISTSTFIKGKHGGGPSVSIIEARN
jgi:hypothetical protein